MTGDVLSTAAVATVAGSAARRVVALGQLAPDSTLLGPAATCSCAPGDNLSLHRLLASAPVGSVLVCAAHADTEHGYFGELMALDAINRGIVGLVVDGAVRDSACVVASGLPVFHRGLAPAPCTKARVDSVGEPVELDGVAVAPGDMVVADRDAVLLVTRAEWADVEARARALETEEVELRAALARGERLGDLLALDLASDS